jgi:hypothetical protein
VQQLDRATDARIYSARRRIDRNQFPPNTDPTPELQLKIERANHLIPARSAQETSPNLIPSVVPRCWCDGQREDSIDLAVVLREKKEEQNETRERERFRFQFLFFRLGLLQHLPPIIILTRRTHAHSSLARRPPHTQPLAGAYTGQVYNLEAPRVSTS